MNANSVNKELAGEFRQVEPRPDFFTVEHERAVCRPGFILPFRQQLAPVIVKTAPEADVFCAISAPIICGDKACVMALGIAEENEIGGEIDWSEITRAVAEHIL